jgi:hypothetical protein
MTASIVRNWRATSCAAVGPTWRIDSPTSSRHTGRSRAASMPRRICSTFFVPKPRRPSNDSAVREKTPPTSVSRPACRRAIAVS